RQRVRAALVVAEVALALILLIGAGLMTKGFRALLTANQNLDPETVLTMRINLPEPKYKEASAMVAFYDQALAGMATVPGVIGASVATSVPYGNGSSSRSFTVRDHPAPERGMEPTARLQTVSPDYFKFMHIPLLKGREFNSLDGPDSMQVAILSEAMARRYWPGEEVLGKQLKIGEFDSTGPWMTIVGIAHDVKYDWFYRDPKPTLYV